MSRSSRVMVDHVMLVERGNMHRCHGSDDARQHHVCYVVHHIRHAMHHVCDAAMAGS